MFFGRRTGRRAASSTRRLFRFSVGPVSVGLIVSAGLLAGCGESQAPLAEVYSDYEPNGSWKTSQDQAQLAVTPVVANQPLIPELADQAPTLAPQRDVNKAPEDEYWAFPNDVDAETDDSTPQPALPTPLPAIDDGPNQEQPQETVELPLAENGSEPTEDFAKEDETASKEQIVDTRSPTINGEPLRVIENKFVSQEHSIAILLPPLTDSGVQTNPHEALSIPATPVPEPLANSESVLPAIPMSDSQLLPELEQLPEEKSLLATLLRDSTAAATGVLTDERVNMLAKKKIQQASLMASRGSLYVARKELIEVLRMISQAKDAQQGTPERVTALAAGLRALREAADFAPRGTQLEAELDVEVLCASHRTPVAKQPEASTLLPALMMDRYLRYAQLQLAMSVAGEPAGSMALHALGKLSSQLGHVEPEQNHLSDRQAIAYQQAALLAHNQNYLAAHELGVLMARSGHFAEAHRLLQHVAARQPNAVVYRNLARVEEELGQPQLALANRDRARQLSQQGATGTNNIQWVSPAQFAQTGAQTAQFNPTGRQSVSNQATATRQVLPGTRPGNRPIIR